jgi:hypothetical protein
MYLGDPSSCARPSQGNSLSQKAFQVSGCGLSVEVNHILFSMYLMLKPGLTVYGDQETAGDIIAISKIAQSLTGVSSVARSPAPASKESSMLFQRTGQRARRNFWRPIKAVGISIWAGILAQMGGGARTWRCARCQRD